MSYTLTNLIPVLYSAADVVSREMVGMIPAVTLDANANRAATGQVIRSFKTRAANPQNIVPGTYVPAGSTKVADSVDLAITKSKSELIVWSGEEQLSISESFGSTAILVDDVSQAMRSLVNEMETDLATAGRLGASRAYGTAGTTPFASDLSDPANILKILQDNGAPQSDRHFTINTTSGAKMRSLNQLTRANEAGTTAMREQGILLDIDGFKFRESAGITPTVAGTGVNYVVNNSSGYAIGATALAFNGSSATGTILAGDIITFAGDPNKYVVSTALLTGNITIAAPGLLQTLANGVAVTVGAGYRANLGFTRNAIALAVRRPAVPAGGDQAIDAMDITDPRSGITFEIRVYPGYHQVTYEVGLAWGVVARKPEHIGILLG